MKALSTSSRTRGSDVWLHLIAVAFVAALAGCSDDGPVQPQGADEETPGAQPGAAPPAGFSISEPVSVSGSSALAGATQGLVYVSASPGTFPDGQSVIVTNLATGESVATAIEDGGFDPIAIQGSAGDELEIVVNNADGTTIVFTDHVPARKKPRVVRTRPPEGQTDVALNTTLLVVFSEPVDASTVAPETIDLSVDGAPVEGAVALSEDELRAELTPAAALAAQTTYTLIITTGVLDRAGDALEAQVVVRFTTQPPVASVTITPNDVTLVPGQTVQLLATLKDAAGNALVGREVTWSSSDEGVAAVDANGLATGIAFGSAIITATSEGVSGTANVTVAAPGAFAQVSTWGLHTCGITGAGDAYCWGHALEGALGIGPSVPAGDVLTPAPVQGGLQFASVSAGSNFTCGVTTNAAPYCWGYNFFGQLGDGDQSGSDKYTPVPVVGGFSLKDLSVGNSHSCGVATSGEAYCWGADYSGELGDGGSTYFGHGSVLVAGDLIFALVSAGASHTCSVTTSGGAHCWGWGALGQLGNGLKRTETEPSKADKTEPFPVSGGLTLTSVSAGGRHTCGITTSGDTYCWGDNNFGQLGTDATDERCGRFKPPDFVEFVEEPCSTTPVPFSGGLSFAYLTAGGEHTCGITTDGDTYCWGNNEFGQLGNGSTSNSTAPTPVTGGLKFISVSAGWGQTCGVTTSGEAYCWGQNHHGQLGDGSLTDSTTPVRVARQP